ncbi:MAG: restriction endonuclease [Pseudomonadota bacterium]
MLKSEQGKKGKKLARRKKSSPFEDLIEVVVKLPWWAGMALALVSYFWLHHVATQPIASPTDMKQMGSFIGGQLWHTFATILQYVIPFACLIGAGISAYKGHERKRLHLGVARSPSRGALERMSWAQFERLVGEVFRRKGFAVKERGGDGPDGGIDLVLHAGNDKYLVQCKQWKAERVGVATVRELFGVMAAEQAAGGFVVTSGQFTDDAKRFAEGRSIELVGTDTLLALIEETADSTMVSVAEENSAPSCPKCGASMVKRTAKKGDRIGEVFWGCSSYPGCRGVRGI